MWTLGVDDSVAVFMENRGIFRGRLCAFRAFRVLGFNPSARFAREPQSAERLPRVDRETLKPGDRHSRIAGFCVRSSNKLWAER